MRLIGLEIENFMAYSGIHHLNLDRLGLVQISGRNLDDPGSESNGAAKTAILEALTWALFGEGLPRRQGNAEKGIQADEVIPDSQKGQTRVKVRLEDEHSRDIVVTRWRKYREGEKGKRTSGVTIYDGGKEHTYLTMAEGDHHIQRALGIDRNIWVRSVIFGQESQFNFCEATAKERANILTTVMGLEEVDRWLGRCRDERTNLRPTIARAEGSLEQLQGQLEATRAENPQDQINAWEADRASRLEAVQQALGIVEMEGKSLKAKREALPEPEQLGEIPEIPPYLEQAHQEARVVHIDAVAAVQRAQRDLDVAVRQLEDLRVFHQNATCPTCGQTITKEHKEECEQATAQRASNADLTLRLAREAGPLAQRTFETLDAELRQAKQAQARAREYQAVHRERNANLERERMVLDRDILSARARWQAAKAAILSVQAEVNPFLGVQERWVAQIRRLEEEMGVQQAALDNLNEKMGVLDWWANEFPRFKTWLFDSIVDTLAAESNRWIKVMTGGVFWVQIGTQKATAKGELRDEIDVQLHRWNPDGTITCRPYRVWSGGEKRRVALAVDLGLSRLMAQRASKPYRFLALDEVDRHLDARGREGLREVLEELRRERETTLVITHDPEFRASFDREIRVTKQGGSSRLEIKDEYPNEGETAQEATETAP